MSTTQAPNGGPTFDAAFEQFKTTGEQVLAAARKAGTLYLDTYEKAVDRAIELEVEFAGLTEQEWLRNLVDAHVDATRELTRSYTTTARSLLK